MARPPKEMPPAAHASSPAGNQPKIAEDVREDEAIVNKAQPPFWLVHHRKRWSVVGGQVIPSLQKFLLANGVNGCEWKRDGSIVTKHAEENLRESKKTKIPYDVQGPGTSYIREVADGVWVSTWETVIPGTDSVRCHDEKGYVEFCRSLIGKVHKGEILIKPPTIDVLERLAGEINTELAELSKTLGHGSDGVRIRVLKANLEAVEAEMTSIAAAEEKARPARGTMPKLEEEA